MQEYFSYKFTGTKEELKKVKEIIKEKSKKDEDYKNLLCFERKIKENHNGIYSLSYEPESSGNISNILFNYEDIMQKLCDDFPNLQIKGTGYSIDFPPFPEWIKKKEENSYETRFLPLVIYLSENNYNEETDSFYSFIEELGIDLNLPAELLRNENGEWKNIIYKLEEFNIELEIYVEICDF